MLKAILSCSLIANVVLSMLFATDPARPRGGEEEGVPQTQASPAGDARRNGSRSPAVGGAAGVDGRKYYENRLSLGLTRSEAKTLLKERLSRQARAALEAPSDRYWDSGAEARLKYASAALDADARTRSMLVSIFGTTAEGDPAFAALFRPLDPHFPFLDSDEQLAVQRFHFERQIESVSAIEAGAPEFVARSDPSGTPGAAGARNGDPGSAGGPSGDEAWIGGRSGTDVRPIGRTLGDVLSDESLLEYQLRDSPSASRLRSAASGLNEQQFRAAFQLLRDIDSGEGDVREHLDVRAALQRIVGPRSFARLWSTRDPVFGIVSRFARQQGWGAATTDEAYALLLRHEEQLLSAVDISGTDASSLAARVQELDVSIAGQLASLVGEDAGRALMNARATQQFLVNEAGSVSRIEDEHP